MSYDIHGLPDESTVLGWNEANDHADDYGDVDDTECEAEFIDGSYTHCGCLSCHERENDELEQQAEWEAYVYEEAPF